MSNVAMANSYCMQIHSGAVTRYMGDDIVTDCIISSYTCMQGSNMVSFSMYANGKVHIFNMKTSRRLALF